MIRYTFDNSKKSFFDSLKHNVDTYFKSNNIHPAGNKKLYVKSLIQVLISVTLYTVLVFFTPSPMVSILLCIILGFTLAVIGFNVMHERGHNSFTRYN